MSNDVYPRLRIYRRKSDKKWGWQLKAANKQIIATDHGQGYENFEDCRSMAERIVKNGEFADVPVYVPSAR